MAVFDGVHYSLSSSLPPARRSELTSVLDLNGATPHPPYTHLIALTASHAHSNASKDPAVKLVTDRWVDRSVVLGKCQPEQYYSPDPAMIFTGVVACATDLSAGDLEVLSAGITALGGQWRTGLTRDVTHLFALRTGSDKYSTALHFAPQTHMCILTPHWFDDAVRLGRRVPEAPYSWPDPLVLRPGVSLDLDDDGLAADGKRKRKVPGDTEAEAGNSTNSPIDGEHVRVWDGRRILLSTALELGGNSRGAIEAGIRRAGGVVVPITDDADEDVEEKAVDECDVFVTRWRSGKSYFKAARASLLIGTLSWLFSVESSGTLHSPLDSLLWYPTPRGGVSDLIDCEISVTNYTGAARDYLKRLIGLVGAKFTPSMSQSNKVLVAGFQPSPKTARALSWSIPVVNHTWLEDCLVEWRALTIGLERYIVYPPGVDFGKMLMTRQDEPPISQSASTPRLSGGAVPGGRGFGIINIDQEETRDAEYRARSRRGGGRLGLSMRDDTFANDTTVDGMSMSRFESDLIPPRPRSRAGSVKMTPSARARRGSMSTPMTASATGAFVDHVVELNRDDHDGRGRRTPTSGGRRPRGAALGSGSRATPRSVSRASSAGLFSSAMEVEVVVRTVERSPKDGKGKERDRSKGRSDVGKRSTKPVEEEDEDVQPARSPKPKSRPVQRKSDVQSARADDAKKRASAQTKKPRPRASKVIPIDLDSDAHPGAGGGEESDASAPPRRAIVAGSRTPVKSGMKPRPRSKSSSRPGSVVGRESENEVRILAAESVTAMGPGKGREQAAKPTRSDEVSSKEKKKEAEKVTSRPRSPTRSSSPVSPDAKNVHIHKRRLSVLVPSVPKDYFSSQSVQNASEDEGESDRERPSNKKETNDGAASVPKRKQPAPAESIEAMASATKRKRGRPRKSAAAPAVPRKSDPQPEAKSKSKSKPKPGVSKGTTKTRTHDGDEYEDMGEGEDRDASMIVEISGPSTGRGGPRRGAANKATTRLREEIMPDVISFEKEWKLAKRKRSSDWGSTGSVREDVEPEMEERGGAKKRKVPREEEEDVEAVSALSVKSKAKSVSGKGKPRGKTSADSDSEMDDPPAKNKPSGSNEKKGGRGRGKESAVIRLLTTGVSLTDDVVKRLTKLGVQMTTKPTDCTHLIAKGFVRTEKFLCAMSVTPHILTEEWANASAKAGKLLPEAEYLLSDAAAERKWEFKFSDALARAKGPSGGPNLFKSMTFYVTPKITVDAKLLKNVVSAGGGQVQTATTPTVRILKGKAHRYVVSCEEDKGIWRPLVEEGFKVYSPELVLRGALRQEMEWEREECVVAG